MAAIPLKQEIDYPTSDGQPMAETTLHRKVMSDLIQGLEDRYAAVPDVWVGGNLFLYYEKGNRSACVSPDVLMARGVAKWDRDTYMLWEEGVPPCLVIEVTSKSTKDEDEGLKKRKYQEIGVEELVLFDPYGEYLRPNRLKGYRLENGRYRPMRLERDGSLVSRTTGLTLRPEGLRLRLVDTITGERLPWHEEIEEARARAEKARTRAEERADAEAAARQAAEERLRALEQELERLRRQAEDAG
jgi:Uma2 family endonuclease